jgi:hypothetical protein
MPEIPICPTCGQPGSQAMDPEEGWACRNEACPEFGQTLSAHEQEEDEAVEVVLSGSGRDLHGVLPAGATRAVTGPRGHTVDGWDF